MMILEEALKEVSNSNPKIIVEVTPNIIEIIMKGEHPNGLISQVKDYRITEEEDIILLI